jgi:hypothetical protein
MRRVAVLLAVVLAVAACQEKLTAPGDCPALCPGGELELRDTVLTPDSANTYPDVGGYVERGLGTNILVSNGLPADDARGIIRFVARADTVLVDGEWLPYTIDSISLFLGVAGRDTLATGLELLVYRIPVGLADSTASFGDIQALLTDANVMDTIAVPDTLESGVIETVYSGAELAAFTIPAADSGVIGIAIALNAPTTTGIRIGGIAGGALVPRFVTYATVDAEDEEDEEQAISRAAAFSSWVSAAEPVIDEGTLVIGGAPSRRGLVVFPFAGELRDSAGIVRATLELTPAETIIGLPNDPAVLQVRAILANFGAKSPPISTSTVQGGTAVLRAPIDTVISVDVTSIVRAWQAADSIPTALLIDLQPEAATFTRLVLETTPSPMQPRLRVTYSLPFEFEAP